MWGTPQNFLLAFTDELWKTRKIRILKKLKIIAGDIIILHMCTKNHNHMRCQWLQLDSTSGESTFYSCPKFTEPLVWSRCEIWSLSDCNWTWTQNHLVCQQTLNHLVKVAKWLSCVLSTYLHNAFDCMFLSCHIHVSE